ncbi:uncharacterized protein LOC101850787 [Aplysia californica]|uniref:Uncharacterized protein LOC101850787 n=1 Tax=Aplysia californica TaxID=6500 RepID=A0ABM0JI61_APLCA|nr:uncharacterized protein LOC101850787 [Aplysia californica]
MESPASPMKWSDIESEALQLANYLQTLIPATPSDSPNFIVDTKRPEFLVGSSPMLDSSTAQVKPKRTELTPDIVQQNTPDVPRRDSNTTQHFYQENGGVLNYAKRAILKTEINHFKAKSPHVFSPLEMGRSPLRELSNTSLTGTMSSPENLVMLSPDSECGLGPCQNLAAVNTSVLKPTLTNEGTMRDNNVTSANELDNVILQPEMAHEKSGSVEKSSPSTSPPLTVTETFSPLSAERRQTAGASLTGVLPEQTETLTCLVSSSEKKETLTCLEPTSPEIEDLIFPLPSSELIEKMETLTCLEPTSPEIENLICPLPSSELIQKKETLTCLQPTSPEIENLICPLPSSDLIESLVSVPSSDNTGKQISPLFTENDLVEQPLLSMSQLITSELCDDVCQRAVDDPPIPACSQDPVEVKTSGIEVTGQNQEDIVSSVTCDEDGGMATLFSASDGDKLANFVTDLISITDQDEIAPPALLLPSSGAIDGHELFTVAPIDLGAGLTESKETTCDQQHEASFSLTSNIPVMGGRSDSPTGDQASSTTGVNQTISPTEMNQTSSTKVSSSSSCAEEDSEEVKKAQPRKSVGQIATTKGQSQKAPTAKPSLMKPGMFQSKLRQRQLSTRRTSGLLETERRKSSTIHQPAVSSLQQKKSPVIPHKSQVPLATDAGSNLIPMGSRTVTRKPLKGPMKANRSQEPSSDKDSAENSERTVFASSRGVVNNDPTKESRLPCPAASKLARRVQSGLRPPSNFKSALPTSLSKPGKTVAQEKRTVNVDPSRTVIKPRGHSRGPTASQDPAGMDQVATGMTNRGDGQTVDLSRTVTKKTTKRGPLKATLPMEMTGARNLGQGTPTLGKPTLSSHTITKSFGIRTAGQPATLEETPVKRADTLAPRRLSTVFVAPGKERGSESPRAGSGHRSGRSSSSSDDGGAFKPRRALVQNTPDAEPRRLSRWSPVPRNRGIPEEEMVFQCTKRSAPIKALSKMKE